MAAVESKPTLSPCKPHHHLTPSSTLLPPPSSSSKTDHIFRSRFPDITIPDHLILHSFLFDKLPLVADRPCLISGSTGRIYTYADTHILCCKTAAGLSTRLGIQKGDVIMLLLQNCPEFVFTLFGASMIGAVSTTANPFYTHSEIFKQLRASGAKLVVTHSEFVHKLRGDDDLVMGKDFQVITVDEPPASDCESCLPYSVLSEADEADIPDVEITPDDTVALPYSSGTTGMPKGVMLTHRSLCTSVAQQVDGDNPNMYLTEDDVLLCVLPLFHIFSLNAVLMIALRRGSGILIMPKFEMEGLLELIQKHRVSVAMVVPPLVLALAKNPLVHNYDLSSIRMIMSGAAPLGKELEDALRQRLPLAVLGQGYGMTEAGPVLSLCQGFAKEPCSTKPGSCGFIVRNAEMKVVDPDTGLSLAYNQPGEICIRGHQIMKGYLNNAEATAAAIDVDGWLHTGDIGYVDDDGEVFVVDRVKEIIKYKGFQVPPAELESLLVSHDSIADAAVIPQKDDGAGEVPVAFVVMSKGKELTEEAVKQFISKQVVYYKKLHKVYFVESIPKSPSGKILRKELRLKLESLSTSH